MQVLEEKKSAEERSELLDLDRSDSWQQNYSRHLALKLSLTTESESEEAKALGIEYKSLEEVLSTSDIVSLNLPLNAETRGSCQQIRLHL